MFEACLGNKQPMPLCRNAGKAHSALIVCKFTAAIVVEQKTDTGVG